jgi:plastocyanin
MGRGDLAACALAGVFAIALSACGGGDDPSPAPSGGGTGTIAATVTINSAGAVTPREVTVPPGSRVTFTNSHSRGHEIASDPHPTHGSCPPIDQVGRIEAGQSRTSGNLNTAGACTYHDHSEPENNSLKGTIRVQ